jgi:hypothetical protein
MSRKDGPIGAANISAAVRSEEQVQCLSKLDINTIRVDLSDEEAVMKAVVSNESALGYLHLCTIPLILS